MMRLDGIKPVILALICGAAAALVMTMGAVDVRAQQPATSLPVVVGSSMPPSGLLDDAGIAADSDVEVDGQVDVEVDAEGDGEDDAADDQGAGGGSIDAGRVWSSCMEHVPEGATRPKLTNTFPSQGLAGHALTLQVQVEHGLGETVLPNGFQISQQSDAARAVAEAGFVFPDPNGGAGPSLSRQHVDGKALTTVLVHVVALPKKPGRHTFTLPPIPIAVARASGELMTLCTSPHAVVIDEPIANEEKPEPQKNPNAREQREVWTLARDLTYGALIGLVVAAIALFVWRWWKRRPKPVPPPPPPRPPWEIALQALGALEQMNLPGQNMHAEHVDQVSDIVRVYLGDRFGFDGIESTTDETLRELRNIPQVTGIYDQVRVLLQDSDLVKFARWYPTDSDCADVLAVATHIVHQTMGVLEVTEAAQPTPPPVPSSTQRSVPPPVPSSTQRSVPPPVPSSTQRSVPPPVPSSMSRSVPPPVPEPVSQPIDDVTVQSEPRLTPREMHTVDEEKKS